MPSTSSLRGTAILAAAFTLAACGSDKAAGPTTANNAQVISEMQSAMSQMDSNSSMEQGLALQLAIVGLSSGAPVNPGNVRIDGESFNFSTTSVTLENRDPDTDEVNGRVTLVVGWRHTNGDSVFIGAYTSDGGSIFLDRRAPSTLLDRSSGGSMDMAGLSRMLRSGNFRISRTVAAGPDAPVMFGLVVDDQVWMSLTDNGISSGSISSSDVDGDCNLDELGEVAPDPDLASCTLQRSSVALQTNTWDANSDAEEPPAGPAVTIPAQGVTGIKFIMADTATVQ